MNGYKTLIWNAANALVLAMDTAKMGYQIPDEWQTYWLMVYIVGNFVLRFVTTGPVGGGNAKQEDTHKGR